MTQNLVVPPTSVPVVCDIEFLARQTSAAKQMLSIAQQMQATGVHGQQERENANQWAVVALRTFDQLEAMRTSITRGLLDAKYAVDNLFTPSTVPLKEAAKLIKKEIANDLLREKEAQDAAYRLAAAAHQAGDQATMTAALVTSSAASTDAPKGTSVRWVWDAQVTNLELLLAQALQDPQFRVFITANLEALDAHAKAYPDTTEPNPIPGVRFVKRDITTVRR